MRAIITSLLLIISAYAHDYPEENIEIGEPEYMMIYPEVYPLEDDEIEEQELVDDISENSDDPPAGNG